MSSVQSYPAKSAPKGIKWEVLYRTPENRATRKRGFRTKREAEAWLTSMEAAKQAGTYVAPSAGKVTVEQVGVQWKTGRGHLKASTIANTETAWNRVVKRWGDVEVGNVRKSAVKAWIAEMVAAGVGVESIENAFSVLRQIMETAADDKRVASNPCLGVKLPHRAHKHLMCLSHERVALLAKAVDERSAGYGTVVRVLAYTGLRWNEFAALKVRCVDLDARRLEVIEGVTEVQGQLVWSTTKTHTRRSVPFPEFLVDELRRWTAGKGPDALVFTASDGSVLRVSNFRPRLYDPARDECVAADPHFPRTTLRKLRNTAASLAIAEGATPKGVQAMLGHKSAAMTLDVYSSLFPSDLDDVADRLHRAASAHDTHDDVEAVVARLGEMVEAVKAIGLDERLTSARSAAAVERARKHIAGAVAALRETLPVLDRKQPPA